MKTKLNPCPFCGERNYRYQKNSVQSFIEHLPGIINPFSNKNPAFLLVKSFKQEIIDQIQSVPLLQCKHCLSTVVVCPKCEYITILKESPAMTEIINCKSCKLGFTICERSSEFDQILRKDK